MQTLVSGYSVQKGEATWGGGVCTADRISKPSGSYMLYITLTRWEWLRDAVTRTSTMFSYTVPLSFLLTCSLFYVLGRLPGGLFLLPFQC
jgi:hypothetical protein